VENTNESNRQLAEVDKRATSCVSGGHDFGALCRVMNYAEFKGRFFKKLKNRSFYIFQPGIIRPSLTLRESRLLQVSPGASPETLPSYPETARWKLINWC